MEGYSSIVFLFLKLLFVVPYISSDSETGVCTKNHLGEALDCCANYRKVGPKCEECWPGTHGKDCMDNCPSGFYGRLCLEKCQCSTCNSVSGCTYLHSAVTDSDFKKDEVFDWRTIVISISGFCGVCISVALIIYCNLRKSSSNRSVLSTSNEANSPPQLNHCKVNTVNSCFTESNQMCEFEPYDTLNLKIKRDTYTDDKTYSYDVSVLQHRRSFVYGINPMNKHEESTKDQKYKTQKENDKEKNHRSKSNTETAFARGMREDLKSSNNEKLQKKKQMEETTKILNDFKPKTKDDRNINLDTTTSTLQPKGANKTLLRYSFASSTEIV